MWEGMFSRFNHLRTCLDPVPANLDKKQKRRLFEDSPQKNGYWFQWTLLDMWLPDHLSWCWPRLQM